MMNLTNLAWRPLAISVVAAILAACGGGAGTEKIPPNNLPPPTGYAGPAPQTADVQKFMQSVWQNVRPGGVAGCGGCHGVSQNPMFARDDDVNLAYAAAQGLYDLASPADSRFVQKVGIGHHCWLGNSAGSLQACADTMTNWVEAWAAGNATGGGKQIQLKAPVLKDVGSSRSFPADSAIFATTVYPLLSQYCSGCHSASSATPQSPFFADPDVATAYAAVRSKIDLDDPAQSRLVLRLRNEFHNCWDDCAANSTEMEDAIRAFAQQVPVTQVDSSLVISKALSLYEGIIASGGSRFEGNQIALWQFKEGSGTTAFDTSGVQPAINLTLSGDVTWVGGWGISVKTGKAQGSTNSSRKLHDLIRATGEYSIEGWVAPANVTQEDARIVSYSASTTQRNFTLGQTLYNYDFFGRSSTTDANGGPKLSTADADRDLQATLQHVVMTFDPVRGRRIYVNGVFTGDADSGGGTLTDWNDTFALVLGNEVSGDRQWKGVIRELAVHNRALTDAQIAQNFAAGVGEKFFLLFNVAAATGAPNTYVLFEVSQFDSYSYLFNKPVFISLDDQWTPTASIPIKGLRIGVNGVEAPVGQAWRNLDCTIRTSGAPDTPPCAPYTSAGVVLSNLGTVIPLSKGPDQDQFFLTFEQLGNSTHVVVEPAPLVPPPPADGTPRPDIGLKVFDEINATMSNVTGVSRTQSEVKATYQTIKQQLPTVEDIDGFLSSHQVAVAQLAIEYCNAQVESPALRSSFYPGFDFTAPAGTAFDTPAKRNLVLDPLINGVVGINVATQPGTASTKTELNALMDKLTACGVGCDASRTKTVVKAVCASVLGSGAMLIQ